MRVVIGMMALLLLVGCANLKHKSFVCGSNVLGILITSADPMNGGFPNVKLGFGSQVIATCPAGQAVNVPVVVGSPLGKGHAFDMNIRMDGTHSGGLDVKKDEIKYTEATKEFNQKEFYQNKTIS